MNRKATPYLSLIFMLFGSLFSSATFANTEAVYESIHETNGPAEGGRLHGWDINSATSAAMQFTSGNNYLVTNISVWLMNTDYRHRGDLEISLCENNIRDDGAEVPNENKCHTWPMRTPPVPMFVPFLVSLPVEWQEEQVFTKENQAYWLVLESEDAPSVSTSWVAAYDTVGFMARKYDNEWQGGTSSGSTTAIIEGIRRDDAREEVEVAPF